MLNEIILYGIPISVSMVLSSFVGWEREHEHKPAGLRTIMLVCLGATVFTIISLLTKEFEGQNACGRILACIVSGIGFLGAAVVFKNEDSLEGITTASVLWAIVGVGILVGLAEYILACMITVCILIILKLKYIRIKIINLKEKKKNGRK